MSTHNNQPTRKSLWHSLLEARMNRRTLFKGAAVAGMAGAVSALPIDLRTAEAESLEKGADVVAQQAAKLTFEAIKPGVEDDIVLPAGFKYDLVAAWGDDIGGAEFGFNADWTGFYPIDLLEKGFDLKRVHAGFLPADASSTDGILVVNNEYPNPMFQSGGKYKGGTSKTTRSLIAEMKAVGMSIVRVKRAGDGKWAMVSGDEYNRRIDGRTPCILTGPAADTDGGPNVVGTVANCSGGQTPWGTALSCEENFQDYAPKAPTGYGWEAKTYGKRHYGWVVEVDPFDPKSTPRKHTAMGRFRHENVAITVTADGAVVAYMGDDKADCCVYKFVADTKLTDLKDRAANLTILESGKLYAADFSAGAWRLLDYDTQDALKVAKTSAGKTLFTSQADVLADAHSASLALKATPMDRPEDIEINPKDGSVFIALTNNTGHGNFHGQIVRLVETDNNPTSETFDWSIFAVGGPQSGFSSPDNMVFDGDGNLWVVTDVSSSRLNKGIYKFMANNSMFMFHTEGEDAGVAYLFAHGPVECEMTGPCWTPDGSTLFLSVQHPGEESPSIDELTSHWPDGGDKWPRPGVVAITGFKK